ncbi:hypothetical protein V5F38_06070 [Xanthobacter sp. V0B-10]|uniref:hypothetical protein n=1 Tax=Xanthobacter albus TaxID=3119929 RepID=UPI00372A1486
MRTATPKFGPRDATHPDNIAANTGEVSVIDMTTGCIFRFTHAKPIDSQNFGVAFNMRRLHGDSLGTGHCGSIGGLPQLFRMSARRSLGARQRRSRSTCEERDMGRAIVRRSDQRNAIMNVAKTADGQDEVEGA